MALLALTLAACDSAGPDDVEEDLPEDPPEVVPPDAFDMDVDLFSGEDPAAQQAMAAKNSEHAHFTNAALRVWPVSVAVGAFLIVPTAVTGAALDADPAVNDGTWIWEATVDTTEAMTFRLEGTPDGQHVDWRMYVTVPEPPQGDPLDDFELYTAETTLDGTSGAWTLFYPFDGEQTEVLNADFTVTDDDAKEITFHVPDTFDEYAGHTVYYAVDGPARTFEWTQGEGDAASTVLVTWDAETHAGSITAPNYNDGEPACWDAELVNVACSE